MLDQTQSPSQARHNGSAHAAHDMSAARHPANGNGSQSTAMLVSQAASQISTLVRSELALAKAELADKGKRFGLGGGLLAGAGLLAGVGSALLVVLAIVLLDLVWPLWLAVLVVMLACFLIAGLAAAFGRDQLRSASPAVPETASSVRRDISVMKDAFHDGRHPDDRWYRYEGPLDEQSHAYSGGAGRPGQANYQDEHAGRGYQTSEAGWGTQIHSDSRGEGWR